MFTYGNSANQRFTDTFDNLYHVVFSDNLDTMTVFDILYYLVLSNVFDKL